jgi:hypothetical protein
MIPLAREMFPGDAQLQAREMYFDADKCHVFDETDWADVEIDPDEYFAACQEEYGTAETLLLTTPRPDAAHSPSPAAPIESRRVADDKPGGWVFSGTDYYLDQPDKSYKREVWVELRLKPEPQPTADFEPEAG